MQIRNIDVKRLSGKNIVITGGTSGIGKASAIKLAENGANLIISGRNEEKGEQAIKEVSTYAVKSKFIKCDVTNKDDVKNLFDLAISEFGQIDCLFNNAGIDGEIASFADSTEENWIALLIQI